MKVLFLRSVTDRTPPDAFTVSMNTTYADRVLGHLTDVGHYCHACQDACIRCRETYRLDFSDGIAGVITFPAVLPAIVEEPQNYLPDRVPSHDILISLAVNEELLIAFIRRFLRAKGIVVPIEESDWISPNAILTISRLCKTKGIEVAFPKPFCSFDPHEGTVLDAFRKTFRIGKPRIDFETVEDRIVGARVVCSAPCGATYYTARLLTGSAADEECDRIVERSLSCYPCTAGHMIDSEFKDSIMHQAGNVHRQAICCEGLGRTALSK